MNNSTQARPGPDAPTNFRATAGELQVALTWDAPASGSGVTRHEYQYKTSGEYLDDWKQIADSAPGEANEASFTVTGLTGGTAYTFELRAVSADGNSTAAEDGPVTPSAILTPPTIDDVAVTSTPLLTSSGGSTPDTYGEGETIEVSVTFNEAVTATTGTDFVLSVGEAKRAPLLRGSGTATLVFGYTVQTGDERRPTASGSGTRTGRWSATATRTPRTARSRAWPRPWRRISPMPSSARCPATRWTARGA